MMPTPEPESSAAEQFYGGALERIRKFILAIAALALVACIIVFRWQVAAGFLVGAIISYLNHRWLVNAVSALGERLATGQSHERGGLIVLRALLRYIFIAAGAYVIFNVSLAGLYGFLGGVCLPIAAVFCEVAVELYGALRRGL
jgi:hypothetical protein